MNKQDIICRTYRGNGLQSAASPLTFRDIHNAIIGFVKPAEVHGAVEDGPNGVGYLFESDVLMGEHVADEDLAVAPANG